LKKFLIAAVVVLALAVIVIASVRNTRGQKGTKVHVDEARQEALGQIVKASGEIDPRVKVNISAHVIGKIERLFVKEGDRIEKGQPFLQLEKEAFIAERDRWAAQLRRAQTEVQQSQVSLTDTRLKLERAKKLQDEGIITREQLEAAQLAETSAKLRLQDAGEAVEQTEANLVKARDDLGKTTIYAPLSGRVVVLNAEEGEVVVSGTMNNAASVIGTIADLSEILAKVDVDETEIVEVRPGQKATVRVDALRNHDYHGHVVEIGSSGFSKPAQPDVTFFHVEILLDDPTEDLRPGMSLRAEIETRPAASTLVVPVQAVVQRAPGAGKDGKDGKGGDEEISVVFVVQDGKARQRPVRTGISDETHVEVLDGVKAGEKVVTGPYRALRDLEDGDQVQISTPEKDKKDRKKKDDDEDKAEASVEVE
jgi:HlyD family secretion protein